MFEKFLRFFVENSRMNYNLFLLVFAIGILSYYKTPKEIFPSFELDMISIKGSYVGASVDILDKMVVSEIEDNLKNVDSVDTISTIVSPGRFTIVLELKKGYSKYVEADKIKDIISFLSGLQRSVLQAPQPIRGYP